MKNLNKESLPRWNLNHLYDGMDGKKFARDFAAIEGKCQKFAKTYQGKLKSGKLKKNPTKLYQAIKAYEAIYENLGKMLSYGGLLYAVNSLDAKIAKFYGDIQEKAANCQAHLVFFALELNSLSQTTINKAIANNKKLAHYQPFLADLRKERPYQLPAKFEKLFLEKDVLNRSFQQLFDETFAKLQFKVGKKTLALEPTLSLLQEKNGKIRRQANDALVAVFKENLPLFTRITNTLAKDKEISDNWRGFKTVADSRHLANRVEPEVVEALTSAVESRYEKISHRYYKLKAKWFGVKKLNHWDRNAPLPNSQTAKVNWQQAKNIVLEAYGEFSPDMAKIARRFFTEKWLDVPVSKGKRGGAFSHSTVPSVHPYIMLNYQGKARDVAILAHELGHGIHQVLAAKQGLLLANTPLTLAETASVFGEMLTFKKLLAQTKNRAEKKALLASKIEDMIATVIRQISFYIFEKKLHQSRKQGELTPEQISQIWLESQAKSLGPNIKLGQGYETFWCYIPHFIHSPFYVYAYAFGDCLVNSLYSVYENCADEKARAIFKQKYMAMLAAGGSQPYSAHLASFGLDAKQANFWHGGLAMIEKFIDELENLA